MSRIKCLVEEGLSPTERVVHITTIDGSIEEVTVPASLVLSKSIVASIVGRDASNALVELPRESATGRWRLWVPAKELIEG